MAVQTVEFEVGDGIMYDDYIIDTNGKRYNFKCDLKVSGGLWKHVYIREKDDTPFILDVYEALSGCLEYYDKCDDIVIAYEAKEHDTLGYVIKDMDVYFTKKMLSDKIITDIEGDEYQHIDDIFIEESGCHIQYHRVYQRLRDEEYFIINYFKSVTDGIDSEFVDIEYDSEYGDNLIKARMARVIPSTTYDFV